MALFKELLVPGIVFIFGLLFYVETRGYPFESLVFPWFLMGIMPVLAGLVLFAEFRRQVAAGDSEGDEAAVSAALLRELRAPAILVAACVGYLIVFTFTNYLIATALFLATTMLVLGVRWLPAVIIAGLFSFSLYFVFGILFEVPI